eukprot:TRINITY_DN53708_c0_g1_i1.p1 TRINITY_DN53708_c0_g1~~TRINITY_DN53708_c0_g1_i1.p1  ORF type:complete len:133 (-),score=18.84 TRINITY_DN53708_c0_g1_i1:69-443(-)
MRLKGLIVSCLCFVWVILGLAGPGALARRGGRSGGTCGLTCYRWRKCKAVLNQLTSSEGDSRPGQRGTTGQLIFQKCDDPPAKCNCEPIKPKEPPKPRMPKSLLEFVDDNAIDWFTNLVNLESF